MNEHFTYHEFPGPPPKKKRPSLFVLYLFIFGVLLGVLLTNTYRQRMISQGLRQTAASGGSDTAAIAPSPITGTVAPVDGLTDYEQAVIAATAHAKSAVVSIYAAGMRVRRFNSPLFDMLYGGTQTDEAMGSGVIIDGAGTVITNSHVISPVRGAMSPKITVELSDGRSFDAKVLYDLPGQDIAVLSIDGSDLPTIEFGDSQHLAQGQTVIAIGNPFGFSFGGEPTVTQGIVSATGRRLRNNTTYYPTMIQTDASINVGNSGGALIDLTGRLVGINTAIYDQGGGSIGIGFAIPIDRIAHILDSIARYGNEAPSMRGLTVQVLTTNLAESLQYNGGTGVVVSDVENGSVWDNAGITAGDIITDVDGFRIRSIDDARIIFSGPYAGEVFDIRLFRNGAYRDITLTVLPRG